MIADEPNLANTHELMKTSLRSVRVLVADDDAVIRVALSELIEGRPELVLVGTAVDAHSAIALASACQMQFTLPITRSIGIPLHTLLAKSTSTP